MTWHRGRYPRSRSSASGSRCWRDWSSAPRSSLSETPRQCRSSTALACANQEIWALSIGELAGRRAAVREVLSNPRYRENAARLQQEIQLLPGPEFAVQLLEKLARDGCPIMNCSQSMTRA
jgi:hypothetical protein